MTSVDAEVSRISLNPGSVRSWLAVDALVTGVNALAYVAAAGPLAELLGTDPEVLRGIGLFLLAFTAVLVLAARAAAPEGTPVRGIVVTNAIWVFASVVVAAANPLDLDLIGRVWVLVQALAVGGLAALQGRTGWQRP